MTYSALNSILLNQNITCLSRNSLARQTKPIEMKNPTCQVDKCELVVFFCQQNDLLKQANKLYFEPHKSCKPFPSCSITIFHYDVHV